MRKIFLFCAALALCASAQAALIVGNVPAANVVSFANGGVSGCSTGATTDTDSGFAVSTDGAACFGKVGWSFLDNGQWIGLPLIADESGTTTITIDLGGSYNAAWSFMDYYLDCEDFSPCGYSGNDPTVTALDSNRNVLESYDIAGRLDGSTSGDLNYLAGDTVGIFRSTADIAYLQIGGDFIGIADLSVGTAPEPATWLLIVAALVLWAGLKPRRLPEA